MKRLIDKNSIKYNDIGHDMGGLAFLDDTEEYIEQLPEEPSIKFLVMSASGEVEPFDVELTTIKELCDLAIKYNHELIVSPLGAEEYADRNEIIICDDWVE